MASLTIKSVDDVKDFISKIDNYDYVKELSFDLSGLNFTFKLEGSRYESSLSGEFIVAIANLQNRIYKSYRTALYGANSRKPLSDAEREMLSVNVIVKAGCTEAIFKLAEKVVDKMDSKDMKSVLKTVGIVLAVTLPLMCVTNTAITSYTKKKLAQLEAEEKTEYIKGVSEIVSTAMSGANQFAENLLAVPCDSMKINETAVTETNLKDVIEQTKPEKEENSVTSAYIEGRYLITGIYKEKVKDIEFIYISLQDEKGAVYPKVSILEGLINANDYQLIKDFVNSEYLDMGFTVTFNNGKLINAILEKVQRGD